MRQIQDELAQQITADFKQAFSGQNPKYFNQLTEGCLVLSVLHPKVKYAYHVNIYRVILNNVKKF